MKNDIFGWYYKRGRRGRNLAKFRVLLVEHSSPPPIYSFIFLKIRGGSFFLFLMLYAGTVRLDLTSRFRKGVFIEKRRGGGECSASKTQKYPIYTV